MVDAELVVTAWNRRSEDLWGLRADEAVGQHFLNLDIGLAVEEVEPIVRSALAGKSDAEPLRRDAVNRRGRTIGVQVTAAPLIPPAASEPTGVIVLVSEQPPG